MNPKISIIVPVYNAEKYLNRCVDSILAQTFMDFEVLLIDDGSTDGSGAICDEYAGKDGRVRVFHKENGGVSLARNVGLENAKGEWITFCDADDWMEADALSVYMKYTSLEDVDIVRCGYNKVHSSGNEHITCNEVSIRKCDGSVFEYIEETIYYGFVWNSLFRRCTIGCVRFDEEISWSEDHLFSAMVDYYCRKIAFVPEILYNHVIRNSDCLSCCQNSLMLINVASKEYCAKRALYVRDNKNVPLLIVQIYQKFVSKAMLEAFYRMNYTLYKDFVRSASEYVLRDVPLTKPYGVMCKNTLPFAVRYIVFSICSRIIQ